jgi:hypothetical protein
VANALKRSADTNEPETRRFPITHHHHFLSRQRKHSSTALRGLSGDRWSIYPMYVPLD